MSDPLKPSVSLLCKLGSVIVHTEELVGPDGHAFDKMARDNVMNDPEVREWLVQMNARALLPIMRRKRSERE